MSLFDNNNNNTPFGVTPPIEKMREKQEAKHEAHKMFIDMLLDCSLESDMPEEHKIGLRIMKSVHKLEENVRSFMILFADPAKLPDTPETFEMRKEALDYITLVGVGLDQYMKQINDKLTNTQTENY